MIQTQEQPATQFPQPAGKTFSYSGDLANATAYGGLFEKTIAEFGSLDILANNAGAIHGARGLKLRVCELLPSVYS